MNLKKLLTLLIFAQIFLNSALAETKESEWNKSLDLYGSFRIMTLTHDGTTELVSKTSRVGAKFSKLYTNEWYLGIHGEYGVNIADTSKEFFFTDEAFNSEGNSSPFSNRLGYVEAKNEKWGTIRAGKQWSVYYDTTYVTDVYNSFGGEASGTYSYFGDGGLLGTGRADNAMTWRNTFGPIKLGLQYVFGGKQEINIEDHAGDTTDSLIYDGAYGTSITYDIGKMVSLSTAYNKANLKRETRKVKADSFAAATTLKYSQLSLDYVFFRGINSEHDDAGIIYNPVGHEVILRQRFATKYSIYGGLNSMKPRDTIYEGRVNNHYKLERYLGGVEMAQDFVTLSCEFQIDESVNADGSRVGHSAVSLYAQVDF